MFALHRQTRSLATRFVFGIVVVFAVSLICGLASHTAKGQVRIGIGVGGGIGGAIGGGVLLDDSYRRQKSQQSEQYRRSQSATESPTKKTAKARNQKSKREDTKVAKDSPPKAKSPEPVASAPQATPLTAGPPPTPNNFGE
jgi:hypothetical protein